MDRSLSRPMSESMSGPVDDGTMDFGSLDVGSIVARSMDVVSIDVCIYREKRASLCSLYV